MDELAALVDRFMSLQLGAADGPLGSAPGLARDRLESICDGSVPVGEFGGDPLDALIRAHPAGLVFLVREVVRKSRTILAPRLLPAGWGTVVASAHEDATNTLAQDHTEFQFPVSAGAVYAVEWLLIYSGNNATGDFRFNFAVTGGTMDGVGYTLGDTAADSFGGVRAVAVNASTSGPFALGTAASLTVPRMTNGCYSFRQNAAGGVFKLQFGNNAAAGGRTSRLAAGSYLRWKQIG